MRRSSVLSTALGFLIFFARLQASDIANQGLFGVFNASSFNNSEELFNYSEQLFKDTSTQSARNLEYQGDGINQRSYYSFTTTGVPTYPILGSSTTLGLTIYTPFYSNPEPTGVQQPSTQSAQQLQGPAQQASIYNQQASIYNTHYEFFNTQYDTQSAMLVNQMLDNSSSTSGIDWTSQSANPNSNFFGAMYGYDSGFTAFGYGPVPNVFNSAPPANTLLQRDMNGQTFVNTFSVQPVVASAGFVTPLAQTDVPEPATAAMLALGLGIVVSFRVRRKRVITSA
jgi:hypothetical protein